MTLDYAPPPPDLAEFVSAYYLFQSDEGGLDDIERASVAQFRLTLAGDGEMLIDGQAAQRVPTAAIIGPRLVPSRVVAKGDVIRVFGSGILPSAWAALARYDASQFANKVIPAELITGPGVHDYAAHMATLPDLQAMADFTTKMARVHFATREVRPRVFIRMVNRWLESDIDPKLDDLAAAARVSPRQVERLTRHYFGAPPKYLARMYRALRAANAIANSDQDWQDLISEAFYDQPHFIREIKFFTGLTPGAIRSHHSRLTQLAFGRQQLAGEVSSLISDS